MLHFQLRNQVLSEFYDFLKKFRERIFWAKLANILVHKQTEATNITSGTIHDDDRERDFNCLQVIH